MDKTKNIKRLKSPGLRMYLLNKIKKHGIRNVALAVQNAFHLSRTGSFDIRTLTILMKPMKKKTYEAFKTLVTQILNKTASSV